jgi:hypothetical protein
VGKYGGGRQASDDNILWHIHIVCWIIKAAYTHSEYVVLFALPWQQWLCECV